MNAYAEAGIKSTGAKLKPMSRNKNGDIICWKCGRPAHEHCSTEAGHREVEISGLCEECFDNMFADEEK